MSDDIFDRVAARKAELERSLAVHEATPGNMCGAEGGCEAARARLRSSIAVLGWVLELEDPQEVDHP